MENKRIARTFVALLASALVVTGASALSANAATTASTTSQTTVSTSASSRIRASFSALSAYNINLTQTFDVAVSVSEGTAPYSYKFGYKQGSKKTYLKTINTGSPYAAYSYKFPKTGTYTPIVLIKDASGKSITYQLSTVTVKDFQASFSAVSPTTMSTEQAFQTATWLSGGKADYTYKFGYIKDGKKTYIKTTKTSAPYMAYVYKFTKAGTYTPFVQVTDADNVTTTSKLSTPVTVKDFKVAFSSTSSYKIDKTQTFQAKAAVSNGSGKYTYRFGYIQDNKKTYLYTSSKTTSTSMTYKYKFTAEGTYIPFVEVMDGENLYASNKLGAVTVKDIQISFNKVSANVLSTQQSAFQANAWVSGGKTDYTYKFGYIKDGKTTYVKSFKTADPYKIYTYKFTEEGSYTPVLQVIDADGVKKTVKMAEPVTVKEIDVSFSKVSHNVMSPEQAFQTSTWVSGGDGNYTYRFGYIKDGKTIFVDTSKVNAPYKAYIYKFAEAGTYRPVVEVADGEGARVLQKLDVDVTVKDFKVSLNSICSRKITTAQSFKLTATTNNGKANYTFRFGYIQNGKKTYVGTKTSSYIYADFTYNFPTAGTYTPFVEVMDADYAFASTTLSKSVTVTD